MNENENILFDCSRGCTMARDGQDRLDVVYREGCSKLAVHNWLNGVAQEDYKDLYEVRFKNTRKEFFINDSEQSLRIGDLVVVEAQSGHDLGIITLEGPLLERQMRNRHFDPETMPMKRIYRRAKVFDIEKWHEAIAREKDVMIRSRQIAADMGLDMKIGDVEFQGDGTKAIFYYIADGRVDFRELIKVFASEFRIRIEMRQIGARQEAGLIGGIGVCGRELCCASFITNFKSITTSVARCQDLSLNPQKLAGQCSKLKCCLNYEVANYLDARSRIPRIDGPLEFEDGQAFPVNTEVLKGVINFSYDKASGSRTFPLTINQVRKVMELNDRGIRPKSLIEDTAAENTEFVSAAGDESISRFDGDKKYGNKKNRKKGRRNNSRNKRRKRYDDNSSSVHDGGSRTRGRGKRRRRNRPYRKKKNAGNSTSE